MKRALRCLAAAALIAGVACGDGQGTTGPAEKALEFTLTAPSSIPAKQIIEIEVRITRASLVNYPLTVTFEESILNYPYAVLATVLLQNPQDRIVRIDEDAARDPLYRVTISEAGQAAALSVSKTVQVDVLDFP